MPAAGKKNLGARTVLGFSSIDVFRRPTQPKDASRQERRLIGRTDHRKCGQIHLQAKSLQAGTVIPSTWPSARGVCRAVECWTELAWTAIGMSRHLVQQRPTCMVCRRLSTHPPEGKWIRLISWYTAHKGESLIELRNRPRT